MCVLISVEAEFPELPSSAAEAVRCPRCGARKIHMNATSKSILDEPDFFISCDHCNHQGMPDKTVDDALANWREQIDFLVMRVGRLTRKWGSQLLPQETGA